MTHPNPAPPTIPGSYRSYQAARLQRATLSDITRLCRLYTLARPGHPESEKSMREWLERGGALLLAGEAGEVLCALRWRTAERGWRLDPPIILSGARGLGFERWLMTKVEALAIRHNVAALTVTVTETAPLPFYERLGYRIASATGDVTTLRKRVGGTWQYQEKAS